MACAWCGGSSPPPGQECPVCNAGNQRRCGHCGFQHPPGARFCAGCSRPVNVPAAMAESALAYLQSHVPPDMVHRMLRSANSMLGERKYVTVLFSDLRGSTSLIDGADPEQALEIIAPAMRVMMDAVHQNEGIVNQTRGDGIMALFGAPLAHEDHAVRACSAALAMLDGMRQLAQKSATEVAIRIGLNSGQVVIHSIGSDLAMHYEASGMTTHLAARMEQLATPGTALLTAATLNLAKGFIEVQPKGTTAVHGMVEPVDIHELTGMSQRTRWQVRSARGLGRLVGRQNEMRTLNTAVGESAAGSGPAAMVFGPPGLGKSRLVHEVIGGLSQDWLVLEAACAPQRMHSSYYPISVLIRALLKIDAENIGDATADHAKAALVHLHPGLDAVAPAILSLLDLDSGEKSWRGLDPSERRLRVAEGVKAVIGSAAERQPLLVVIEDLHWADAESRLIVENLAGMLGHRRFMLLATQRPGGPEMLAGKKHLRLPLSLFDETEARRHVDQLLGDDIGLVQIKRRILEQAQGNPLFIEELVHALIDRKALDGLPSRYRLHPSAELITLPETIHSVIAARIDYLDAFPKSLLQTCAVIGKDISVSVLSRMVGMSSDELVRRLEPLESAEFLVKTRSDANADFAFKHELTREIALNSLLLSVRRSLHARAVAIIESTAGSRLDAHVDQLAHHAFSGELWEKAVPYLMRSGLRALKRAAMRDAITILERGIEAASHLPPSEAKTQAEIDFRLALTIPLEPLGRHRRIYEVLGDAHKLTDAEKDPRRAAAVACQLSVAMFRLGEHSDALAVAETAKSIAERLGDAPLLFAATHNIGIAYHAMGQFARAVELHRQCLAMEKPEIDLKRAGWAALPSVMLRTFLTDSLIEMGRLDEAAAYLQEGTRHANEANHAYSRITIDQVRGRLQVRQGHSAEAVATLRSTWQRCNDLEIIQHYPILAARLGEAYLAAGQPHAARDVLEAPEKLDVPLAENAFGWAQLFLEQGRTMMALGRYADAFAAANNSLRLAEQRGEPPMCAYAKKLLGEISLAVDELANPRAVHFFEEARDIAVACGMQPLAEECAKSLGPHQRPRRSADGTR